MAINKVGSKGIVDCSVAAVDFAPGTITSVKLADGTVTNAKLSNSSITASSTTVALGASGTLNNFFIDWQSVVVSDGSTVTTMVAGNGYFVNNTSAAGLVKLPASASIGDTVIIKDYAGNFGTNSLTIQRNGHNIQGVANDSLISTNRASLVLVYVDSTKGWLYTDEHNVADLQSTTFNSATGGTVTTVGDFKVHAFTGDGNFVVSSLGNAPASNKFDFVVVAGGGGGGYSGGGGAGGLRLLQCQSLPATTYPVTVGGGGTGVGAPANAIAPSGANSVFSTTTSAGGGGGGHYDDSPPRNGGNGGSGGGGSRDGSGGSGNTPSVSPPQGNNGGNGIPGREGGGGGAATAGSNGVSGTPGSGAGGAGFNVAPVFGSAPQPFYAADAGNDPDGNQIAGPTATGFMSGGGTGALTPACASHIGFGSNGGGGRAGTGNPNPYAPATMSAGVGTANSGGGGGGHYSGTASNGGKGVVLIKYRFQ